MMTSKEWRQGLLAWQNIKLQAEKDLEQTSLLIPVFEQKILELEEKEKETEMKENGR